jgi:large subunit ribosomal protein L23
MNLIDLNNEIAFVVDRKANKKQIKYAFEDLYEEKVERVNTHITPRCVKVAYIKLVEEEMAEEIAVRLGVF